MFLDILPSTLLKSPPRASVSQADISQLERSFEKLEITPSTMATPLSSQMIVVLYNTPREFSLSLVATTALIPRNLFAVKRAIREIINPVVEISGVTAGIATALPEHVIPVVTAAVDPLIPIEKSRFSSGAAAVTSTTNLKLSSPTIVVLYNPPRQLSPSLVASPALVPVNLFAVKRANHDIINPVVERSVTLAKIATVMPEHVIYPLVTSAVLVSTASIKNEEMIGALIPSVKRLNIRGSSSTWGNVLKVFVIVAAVEVAIVGLVLVELIVRFQDIEEQIVAGRSPEWSQPC
jgi:hypothetical protein